MLDDVSVLTTGSAASRRPKRPWTPVQTLASVDSRPASTRSDRSITSVSLNESFRRRKHRYPPYKPGTFGCARRFPPDEQRISPIGGVELGWPGKTRRRRFINTSPWLAPRRDDAHSFTRDARVKLSEDDGSLLSAWSPDSQARPAGRRSLVSQPSTLSVRSRCSTPVERRRQATREATNPQRLRAANAKLKKRQAARDVLYLYERRFEVPFAEPCINGDNRPITAPGNCWLEKSMLLPQPATSTRLRHNVERPRANYHRRDGRPKTPGAGRARRHESKWFQTLGLARSIALRA